VSPLAYALLFPAGVVAGFVGTTAGLASLISYPALLVAGLPPVTANVTNTVALFGSGVSSIAGSQQELRGEGRWLAGWAVMTAAEVVAMVHQEADDPAGPIEPRGRQVWLPQRGLGDRQGVDRVRLAVAAGTVTSLRHELGMHSDDAPAGLQTLNHAYAPRDARFTNRFLVVTPGITIRDRLRVLLPSDDQNYYRLRDLVPADLWDPSTRPG